MESTFGDGNTTHTTNDDRTQFQMICQRFSVAQTSPSDLQFEHKDGRILNAFVHGDRAWLLFRYDDGDAGFSTRNLNYVGPEDAMLTYTIGNGQEDEYPASWTIPIDEAIHAVEYFLRTGEKTPQLTWHDDR